MHAVHTSSLAAAILLLGTMAGALAADAVTGVEIKTEHYDLYCEGPNAEEYGRLLEQLHAQLKEFFGDAPKERMRVKMLADSTSYIATLKAAGVENASGLAFSNGVYYTGLKTAFVKRRPSLWLTSADLVHECTHQFHCLTKTKDRNWPSSRYYSEGLARYFEFRHRWDGTSLQATDVDIPYPEKVQRALDRFRSERKRALRNIVTDPGYGDPTKGPGDMDEDEAHLFVRFLIENSPAEFHALAARLDQRDEPAAAWDETIGRSATHLNERYENWLAEHLGALPFEAGGGCWVPAAGWVEGTIESIEKTERANALLSLRAKSEKTTLQVRRISPAADASVLIGATPNGPFWFVQVAPDGQIGVLKRDNDAGTWTVERPPKLESRPQTMKIVVRWDADHWIVQIDDGARVRIPAPKEASVGAAITGLAGARAEFRFEPSGDAAAR